MGRSGLRTGSPALEPMLPTSSLGEALPDSSLDTTLMSHPLAILVPTIPG